MAKKYGLLEKDWRQKLRSGFSEAFRVLEINGVLIFKWNETQVAVSAVAEIAGVAPLFGHKSGKNSKTHWLCFRKP